MTLDDKEKSTLLIVAGVVLVLIYFISSQGDNITQGLTDVFKNATDDVFLFLLIGAVIAVLILL